MAAWRWLTRFLSQLGLEFWLPLPLVAAGLWGGFDWVNGQVLSQTSPAKQLQPEPLQQVELALTLTILSIDAEINQSGGSTEVVVQTGGSALRELEFEYPVATFAEVEAAIAQELNLPASTIRRLIRYRLT